MISWQCGYLLTARLHIRVSYSTSVFTEITPVDPEMSEVQKLAVPHGYLILLIRLGFFSVFLLLFLCLFVCVCVCMCLFVVIVWFCCLFGFVVCVCFSSIKNKNRSVE